MSSDCFKTKLISLMHRVFRNRLLLLFWLLLHSVDHCFLLLLRLDNLCRLPFILNFRSFLCDLLRFFFGWLGESDLPLDLFRVKQVDDSAMSRRHLLLGQECDLARRRLISPLDLILLLCLLGLSREVCVYFYLLLFLARFGHYRRFVGHTYWQSAGAGWASIGSPGFA